MKSLGRINIFDDDGTIWLKVEYNDNSCLNKFEGLEGSGETLTEAVEDLFISLDMIGE